MKRPAIVVLTPLKNDAWIVDRFLKVSTRFADRIVIADQGSSDGGAERCRAYGKVTLVANPDHVYDEAARQRLLLDTARRLVPLPRVLIALDADEILAANAQDAPGWRAMLEAQPGTSLQFEKPNLYLSPERVERRPLDFPGGFVDDGLTPHQALRIHSLRLPVSATGARLVLDDVKFLHYALLRPGAQKAKFRMYAALENVMATKSLYARRRYYWSRTVLRATGPVQPTPREWFDGWERCGIDMTSVEDVEPYWQDVATLELLLRHGSLRFWLDDIWEKDWRALRLELGRSGRTLAPPRVLSLALDLAQRLLEWLSTARRAGAQGSR